MQMIPESFHRCRDSERNILALIDSKQYFNVYANQVKKVSLHRDGQIDSLGMCWRTGFVCLKGTPRTRTKSISTVPTGVVIPLFEQNRLNCLHTEKDLWKAHR